MNPTLPKITILQDEEADWCAVYRDDEKFSEGHSINLEDLLVSLGFSVLHARVVLEKGSLDEFPDSLSDHRLDPCFDEPR